MPAKRKSTGSDKNAKPLKSLREAQENPAVVAILEWFPSFIVNSERSKARLW